MLQIAQDLFSFSIFATSSRFRRLLNLPRTDAARWGLLGRAVDRGRGAEGGKGRAGVGLTGGGDEDRGQVEGNMGNTVQAGPVVDSELLALSREKVRESLFEPPDVGTCV